MLARRTLPIVESDDDDSDEEEDDGAFEAEDEDEGCVGDVVVGMLLATWPVVEVGLLAAAVLVGDVEFPFEVELLVELPNTAQLVKF